jgi:hypothetical protein
MKSPAFEPGFFDVSAGADRSYKTYKTALD